MEKIVNIDKVDAFIAIKTDDRTGTRIAGAILGNNPMFFNKNEESVRICRNYTYTELEYLGIFCVQQYIDGLIYVKDSTIVSIMVQKREIYIELTSEQMEVFDRNINLANLMEYILGRIEIKNGIVSAKFFLLVNEQIQK